MNIFDIFLKSSILTQIVMLLLLIFSVLSWGIIVYHIYIIHITIQEITNFEHKLLSGISLSELYQNSGRRCFLLWGIEQIFYSGFQKFSQLYYINHYPLQESLKETMKTMSISMYEELEELEKYTIFLNIIGSISPYLGLLGTILSIIHIFFTLGTTVRYITLQMITPGLAEALIFTAGGLFVAIPAIIGFHHMSVYLNSIEKKYNNFLEKFISILKEQILLKSN